MKKVFLDEGFLLGLLAIAFMFVVIVLDSPNSKGISFKSLEGLAGLGWSLFVSWLLLTLRIAIKNSYARLILVVTALPSLFYVTYLNLELLLGFYKGSSAMGYGMDIMLMPIVIFTASFIGGCVMACLSCLIDRFNA